MAELPHLPDIRVLEFESIGDALVQLPHRHKYFTLLLAWDAPTTDLNELEALLQPIADSGLVYLCAWGQNCEAVHDAVDLLTPVGELGTSEEISVVMTTWHENESLQEAVWYFQNLALPSDNKILADCERFAVAVGNPAWAKLMKEALAVVS